jgi:hypothetical protein
LAFRRFSGEGRSCRGGAVNSIGLFLQNRTPSPASGFFVLPGIMQASAEAIGLEPSRRLAGFEQVRSRAGRPKPVRAECGWVMVQWDHN